MKRLLTLCLCVCCFYQSNGQCDYSTLLREGKNLFEKQEYRAALKKFNAARTCAPSHSADIDREINKVFDAIEAQRDKANTQSERADQERNNAQAASRQAEAERQRAEQEKNNALENLALANALRDSALRANQLKNAAEEQKALLVELYDLQRLADNLKAERRYREAIGYYEKLIGRLERVPSKDSILLQKYIVVQADAHSARVWQEKQARFEALIDSAEQQKQAGLAHFPEAYHFYLMAAALQYDSLLVLRRLSGLEVQLGERVKPIKYLKGLRFYALLGRSAEANLLMGNAVAARKRIVNVLRYQPLSLDFVQNPDLRVFARSYNRKLVHRFGVYFGMKVFFPNKSQTQYIYSDNVFFSYLFGCNWDFRKGRSGIGLEFAYKGFYVNSDKLDFSYSEPAKPDRLKIDVDGFGQVELSGYYYHDFFKINNKKWNNTLLRVQATLGLGVGVSNSKYDSYANSFIVPENLRNSFPFNFLYAPEYGNTNIFFNRGSDFQQDGLVSYRFTERQQQYFDLFATIPVGIKVVCYPINKRFLSIFGEFLYSHLMDSGNSTDERDLQIIVSESLYPEIIKTEEDKNTLATAIGNKVLYYRYKYPEFHSGFHLKFGLAYRF